MRLIIEETITALSFFGFIAAMTVLYCVVT